MTMEAPHIAQEDRRCSGAVNLDDDPVPPVLAESLEAFLASARQTLPAAAGELPVWKYTWDLIQKGVLKFDKSANAEDQKVSLPILDENGAAVGAGWPR